MFSILKKSMQPILIINNNNKLFKVINNYLTKNKIIVPMQGIIGIIILHIVKPVCCVASGHIAN